MRISTHQYYQLSVNALLDQQAKASKSLLHLSTGKRMLSPSDDPTAAAQVLNLQQANAMSEQYRENADAARRRLNMEETVLASATDVLQRAYVLSVQANNGTTDADGRRGIASEVDQLLESLLGLANTKDANGDYLFAGARSDTRPFAESAPGTFSYQGDQTQRRLQIGPSRSVADGDPGHAVFMDVQDINGATRDVFSMLHTFKTDLEANSPSGDTIDNLRLAMDKLTETRAKVGARLNAIDVEVGVAGANELQLQTTLSELQDLDYAEAVSRLNLQLTGLQAAQQSYVRIQGLSLFNFL